MFTTQGAKDMPEAARAQRMRTESCIGRVAAETLRVHGSLRSLRRAVDLDVCNVVRRYKSFGSGDVGYVPTLVDVITLYPASALPTPLPPDTSTPARSPPPTANPARCESSNDCLEGICIDGFCRSDPG